MLAAALSGCGEGSPPTTIRAYTEPTQTVDASSGEDTASVSIGALTPEEARELESRVRLVNVSFAADGAYLIVNFYAPPQLAIHWQPGQLYVVDQATRAKYDNIPFMPKIGFLIARPTMEEQPGYVMLENQPPLEPGSLVTVILGGFEQTDVAVDDAGLPEQ